jgi:quercetin dioxygenase-like cupin family protein
MLLSKQIQIGSIGGVIYTFEDMGDTLEMHSHQMAPETNHITIVCRGKVRVFGVGWEKEANAGDIFDWKDDQWHGFEALEPNCKLINIRK